MKYDSYKNNPEKIILRDSLAIDRTKLANERTYLSYMRTVVSFSVAAITLLKLLGGIEGVIVAIILVISAVYFYIRGSKLYKEVSENLDFVCKDDKEEN
ncbi:putative membrane protein [Clostridium collagenovorans DSM 3089]|uniref:Putative membrane protein n=1 Tax=Clostridium collagenovorans DSM 3089 TaxID=1121306 RepID=A0A1M5UY95_9CLOT|nr:DUF202 domain-containing protein [Clostridium collagenovorans]SHH67929.1 putative membrane protein [Clostridium collagenovorans DSM 3089]